MTQRNHIDTVRAHILAQMQALRTCQPEDLKRELERAKGISELAQVAVNTAKVEVDYIGVTKQESAPFMEPAIEVDSDSSTAGVQALQSWPHGGRVHKLQG